MDMMQKLAAELSLTVDQVEKTVALIDEGNTIPFISRYRKEVTGGLDDTILRKLEERLRYLRNIEARKAEVIKLITEQEKMTPELEAQIMAANTITEVDDIYRPFRPHRKTRASVARERGLEPLAAAILAQEAAYTPALEEYAATFVDQEKGVPDAQAALQGAMDIIAEDISDSAEYRKKIRFLTFRNALLQSRQAKEEDSVYAQYYEYSEPVCKVPGHRVLAINRGEKEEFLKVAVDMSAEIVLNYLFHEVVKPGNSPAKKYVEAAITDGYERLIAPSVEREIRNDLFDSACEGAILLFSDNLRQLLMQAPIKGKTVLGFDPGYAHGCKIAVVDETGRVLDTAVIYPVFKGAAAVQTAKETVKRLIRKHQVSIAAIGNGTASRETEQFFVQVMKELDMGDGLAYMIVSESGASVYSASKLAAEEFPQYDVNIRSAISIARRLQDPLAELVKIDPKAIGVGQYQHDLKPAELDAALDGVVEDCVNAVGVDVNTASVSLLSHVAGINKTIAKNIVAYREENGAFTSRAQLKKVPRLGPKAFEQCAGFLRVPGGKELIENTGVHPESYDAAKGLLKRFGLTPAKAVGTLYQMAEEVGFAVLAAELNVGEPTLRDIAAELSKPGRDPRDELPPPILRSDVMEMKDLKPGLELKGTVRNVTDFGAFVDIGVHQDGLVHISQFPGRRINHPSEAVRVGDIVTVWIKDVDMQRKRIALTMRKPAEK